MGKNATRLAYIMSKFGVTGKELAEYLHVDYSLVSKWKNNRVILRNGSRYVNRIVEYFLNLDSPKKNKTIIDVLKRDYPESDFKSEQIIITFLKKWLTEKDNNFDLLINTNNYGNAATAQFDIYKYKKGRRDAYLRFLDIALSLPAGQDMLVFTQEDITWNIEDAAFVAIWEKKIKEILRRGDRLIIIHFMERHIRSMFPLLTHWLPLEAEGQVLHYYIPTYANPLFKTTLFIVKDKVAFTGISTKETENTLLTYFFTDPAVVQHCQSNFHALLDISRPLFEQNSLVKTTRLPDVILDAQQQKDNSYVYSSLPWVNTMTRDVFHEILTETNFDHDSIKDYLLYFERLQQAFFNTIKNNHYRQIYDLDILEQILTHDYVIYSDLSFLTGSPIKVPTTYLHNHLQNIIDLAGSYPNFQIALTRGQAVENLRGISLYVKENTITLANTLNIEVESSFSVSISEPTLVNSFYHYFDNIWNSIPSVQRNKSWVISKLRNLLIGISTTSNIN